MGSLYYRLKGRTGIL